MVPEEALRHLLGGRVLQSGKTENGWLGCRCRELPSPSFSRSVANLRGQHRI